MAEALHQQLTHHERFNGATKLELIKADKIQAGALRHNSALAMALHSTGNSVSTQRELPSVVRCGAVKKEEKMQLSRREAMVVTMLGTALPSGMAVAAATSLPPALTPAKLCDADCEKELQHIPRTTTASGLQYKDIVVGSGESPPVCFQNQGAANFVAMRPNGKVFDRSLEKGVPYIFQVGAKQVIKGLDEGILRKLGENVDCMFLARLLSQVDRAMQEWH